MTMGTATLASMRSGVLVAVALLLQECRALCVEHPLPGTEGSILLRPHPIRGRGWRAVLRVLAGFVAVAGIGAFIVILTHALLIAPATVSGTIPAAIASASTRLGGLSFLLAVEAGCSVYLCASILIPEGRAHPPIDTLVLTIVCCVIMYGLASY